MRGSFPPNAATLLRIGAELAFACALLAVVSPLWMVERPPLEDFPQHVAIVRILHDFDVAELGFASYYRVALAETQHIAWYLAADALSFLFGAATAVKLLLTISLVAAPYAARSLLRAMGRDEGLAWLSLGLTWTSLLIFGFVQFLAAIPLWLFGLALAVRMRAEPTRRLGLLFSLVTVLCFFTHAVPFGLLVLGSLLVLPVRGVRPSMRRLVWLVPSVLCVLAWIPTTVAGRSLLGSVGIGPGVEAGIDQASAPIFFSADRTLRELHEWMANVLTSSFDDGCFAAWGLTVLACVLLSKREAPDQTTRRRLALLAIVTAAGYFLLPIGYAWIWPINPRFILLAAWLVVVVLPAPTGLARRAILVTALVIALLQANEVGAAFRRFDTDELGHFERAIAHVPRGRRTAALIFESHSQNVTWWPFAHFIGWLQAERGGAVVFSFADHPSSPVRWRDDAGRPETGPTGFRPESTPPSALTWFDYVLVHAGPGPIDHSPLFTRVYEDPIWRVYRRVGH